MMPDSIVVHSGKPDGYGGVAYTPPGATPYPCRLVCGPRPVRDPRAGRERGSTVQVIVGAAPGLTVDRHRYTLPSRYTPSGNLTAINVKRVSDENGPHHEVVWLP